MTKLILTSFACLLLCLCLTAPAFAAGKHQPATDTEVEDLPMDSEVLTGNVKTKKFHNSKCEHYNCKPCTAKFKNRKAAEKAGYKPCGKCGG